MADRFENREERQGTVLKLYRGEGMGLLAFDLEEGRATPDFVGFSVEVKPPGSGQWFPLRNRLRFNHEVRDANTRVSSLEAPFQK